MANLKTAIKRVRINETRRLRNKPVKTNMRNYIKRVEQFVEANDVENAKIALNQAVKVIDKAVQKGVVHKNAGTRYKSRLAKKVDSISE